MPVVSLIWSNMLFRSILYQVWSGIPVRSLSPVMFTSPRSSTSRLRGSLTPVSPRMAWVTSWPLMAILASAVMPVLNCTALWPC